MLSTRISSLYKVIHLRKITAYIYIFRITKLFSKAELYTSILPVDEVTRAEKFLFLKDQQRFIICHGILRQILSRYIRVQPYHILFDYNQNGKPSVIPKQNPENYRFNLSHSGDMVLVGITQGAEIGVDIEEMKPIDIMDDILLKNGTNGEVKKYHAIPKMKKKEYFYKWFTRKEAYVKATGEGLSKIFQTTDASQDHEYETLFFYAGITHYCATMCVNRKELRAVK